MTIEKFYDDLGEGVLGSNNIQDNREIVLPDYINTPYKYVEEKFIDFSKGKKKKVFLDLCCGVGRDSILPAKLGWKVIGVDISKTSIEAARKLAAENGVESRITFIADKALDYLKANKTGSFEAIYLSGSLYYLELEEVLAEIKRTLSKSGYFYLIETYGGNIPMDFIRFLRYSVRKAPNISTRKNLLRKKEIAKIMKAFPKSKIIYFDFFTLFGALLPKIVRKYYLKIAKYLDNILLNKLKIRWLAFKFVVLADNSI